MKEAQRLSDLSKKKQNSANFGKQFVNIIKINYQIFIYRQRILLKISKFLQIGKVREITEKKEHF